jgi:hypothetical protein
MAKEETKKEEQEIWGVGWTQGTATNPPERVIVNSETEEGYDVLTALAILLNNQEKLKKLLD